jgi:hypothetical protein
MWEITFLSCVVVGFACLLIGLTIGFLGANKEHKDVLASKDLIYFAYDIKTSRVQAYWRYDNKPLGF